MSTETPPATAGERPAGAPEPKQAGGPGSRGSDGQESSQGRQDQGQEKQRSLADWTALAMSATIVLALVGLTTYFYVTGPEGPAVIEVEPQLDQAFRGIDQYYLPVRVRNRGSMTGEDVRVKVILTDAQGRRETAEIAIPFLPGGAESQAIVAFPTDPARGELEVNVVSYLKP